MKPQDLSIDTRSSLEDISARLDSVVHALCTAGDKLPAGDGAAIVYTAISALEFVEGQVDTLVGALRLAAREATDGQRAEIAGGAA